MSTPRSSRWRPPAITCGSPWHERRGKARTGEQLLNELRVALPGVQILFAFLLTVPFAQGFQRVTKTQKTLFYATLLATALSTICLIAPSATTACASTSPTAPTSSRPRSKYTIADLGLLGVAIVLAIAIVTIYDTSMI